MKTDLLPNEWVHLLEKAQAGRPTEGSRRRKDYPSSQCINEINFHFISENVPLNELLGVRMLSRRSLSHDRFSHSAKLQVSPTFSA